MNEELHTKFGTARLNKRGYYWITSGKEGNNREYLHRLIFREFFGEIPNGFIVHHKDGNKRNNCILNLQLLKKSSHDNYNNSTGFYRVSKFRDKNYALGFRWRYIHWKNGKSSKITSSSLLKLKNKVLARGWEWKIHNEPTAIQTCDEYGYELEELC